MGKKVIRKDEGANMSRITGKVREDLDIDAIILETKALRASMTVMLKSIEGYFTDYNFDCYEAEAMINQLEHVIKHEMSAFDRIFDKFQEAGIEFEQGVTS